MSLRQSLLGGVGRVSVATCSRWGFGPVYGTDGSVELARLVGAGRAFNDPADKQSA